MKWPPATLANIQGGVGDSRSKAVWPASIDEFVARPRPHIDRHAEVLGGETPRPDPGPIFLDGAGQLPKRLA